MYSTVLNSPYIRSFSIFSQIYLKEARERYADFMPEVALNNRRQGAAPGEKAGYDPTKPFIKQITELIRSTHPKEGPVTVTPFGKRFMVEMDERYWGGFCELTSNDGIGTKADVEWRMSRRIKNRLHQKMNTVQNGAQDAFAMVVDDLIEGNFRPVKLRTIS